jgi:hypothetical protein
MTLDIDHRFAVRQVSGQRTMIAIGRRVAPPTPFARGSIGRILPGPVLGDRPFQIFQPELQLIAAQPLGTAADPMAEQTGSAF